MFNFKNSIPLTTFSLSIILTISFLFSISGNATGFVGTFNDDILNGTSQDDIMYGQAGNDTIFGRGGNDIINGGQGADIMYGQAGNDTIFGRGGNDIINGGQGADIMYGEAGNDTFRAVDVLDKVLGAGGSDTIFLAQNPCTNQYNISNLESERIFYNNVLIDNLSQINLENKIVGGIANNRLTSLNCNDIIDGRAGNDIINSNNGNDIIDGGLGSDRINGGNGDDRLFGGRYFGETIPDTMTGGAGSDQFATLAPYTISGLPDRTPTNQESFGYAYGFGLTLTNSLSRIADTDIITDFEPGVDKIGLNATTGFSDLYLNTNGSVNETTEVKTLPANRFIVVAAEADVPCFVKTDEPLTHPCTNIRTLPTPPEALNVYYVTETGAIFTPIQYFTSGPGPFKILTLQNRAQPSASDFYITSNAFTY
jgi:Ca2+-binding RTX toxin-like protein